jgi:hypothetical protein
MMGRRTAALLCVLLVHALVIFALLHDQGIHRVPFAEVFTSEPITLYLEPLTPSAPDEAPVTSSISERQPRAEAPKAPSAAAPPAGESAAITTKERVDWPIEAKKSAARVLAAEAEAERVARMFAGPGGTWASLTKRQRSRLSKFHWKPGVDGFEYDEKGNAIYHLPNGCSIVNLAFFTCPIGSKPKIHGDMFQNMREYFDEQRLPLTDEGNGTEPEAMRPAN